MQKRVPMVVSPLLGAAMIGRMGLRAGIRTALPITITFGVITVPVLWAVNVPLTTGDTVSLRGGLELPSLDT